MYLKFLSILVDKNNCLIPIFLEKIDSNSCKAPKGQSHPQNKALPQIIKDNNVNIPIRNTTGSIKKVVKLLLKVKMSSKIFIKCITLN